MLYQALIRPILFGMEPERSHEAALACLAAWGPLWRFFGGRPPAPDPRLAITVCGLRFPTPVGLAGGLDKEARALWAWPALGFGFVEVGTVTAVPQPGNPRPRVFRLPEDQALINRLGFNSPGARAVAERLAALRRRGGYPIPLSVNIGRSRDVGNDAAGDDYVLSLDQLHPYADFLVVNISSPNTPGLRSLQARAAASRLLVRLAQRNRALGEKPLFVKVAPDLSESALEEVVAAVEGQAHGLVATNTTVRRDGLQSPCREEAGGLSGRPLRHLATRVIRSLRRLSQGRLPIIGVGGISTAEDAYEKIRAGASLVQLYTGLIYQGPAVPRRIARGLTRLLARDGYDTLAQAVGADSE